MVGPVSDWPSDGCRIRHEFEAFAADVCDEASVEAKHQLHEEKSQAAGHRDDGGCS